MRWYRHRLAAMSAREVLFRIEEQTKRLISRRYIPKAELAEADRPSLPVLPQVENGLSLLRSDQELLREWQQQARDIRQGKFKRYGIEWPPFSGLPDWHVDPVSGIKWPHNTYCYDLNYRNARQYGDIKLVWELSRFHYLQPLAALARLSNDAQLAGLVWAHVEDWIANNPPGKGPHWVSSCELAIRVMSLLIISSLIGGFIQDVTLKRLILRCLAQHGFWLFRFPSRYSSANHSLLAEAGALFLLGITGKNLRQAQRWQLAGRDVLEQEILSQILSDGSGAEQSVGFSLFSIEILLLCASVAARHNQPFSPTFLERLAKAGAFIRALTDKGGHLPQIGDFDDVRIISAGNETEAYGTSILACMGPVLNKPSFAVVDSAPDFRYALLVGDKDRSHRGKAHVPRPGIAHFKVGGYTVSRSQEFGAEALLIFDHGNVGYLSIAAHGHADALAVLLHIDGKPVLVDAGTYLYRAQPGWRNYFRGTAAHNTLIVNDENSSIAAGSFNWQHKANTEHLNHMETGDQWCVEAAHDGYFTRYNYRHNRMVEKTGPGLFRIVDRLLGNGGVERVEAGFLFAPDLDVVNASGGFAIYRNKKQLLYIRHEGPLKGWVERGLMQPKRGWYAPNYGTLQPTSRLVFTGKMWHGATAQFTFSLRT